MNKTHKLKTWPDVFQGILDNLIRHQFRRNDRNFLLGDILHLREFIPSGERYTGREIRAIITAISYGPEWGIPTGFVAMSIKSFDINEKALRGNNDGASDESKEG